VLSPASLPQVIVPAALGGGANVGDPVVAVGNPLGLADSVSAGVVSGVDRTAQTAEGTYSGLIQFDASVNPGSSGGPLLDARGLVVGIVVSIANPAHEDAFAGIGFAVPIGAALGGPSGTGQGPQL
jgi:S1-C subfamily serine protease